MRFAFYVLVISFWGIVSCGESKQETKRVESVSDTVKIKGEIKSISEEFANINTELTGAQLLDAGFILDGWISVTHNEKTIKMPLVKNYGDVEEGEWLARIDEEDNSLQIAINLGNAATDIGASLGDILIVRSLEGDSNPATTQPATTQPATTQPATTQPATTQPAN